MGSAVPCEHYTKEERGRDLSAAEAAAIHRRKSSGREVVIHVVNNAIKAMVKNAVNAMGKSSNMG